MKSIALCLTAVLGLAAASAFAAEVADTDGNGSFSMEEVVATNPDVTEESFAAMDTDKSGDLSVEELDAATASGALKE